MITPALEIDQQVIRELCDKYPIYQLSLFGSVLRDDFSPQSDVDVLIEFLPDAHVTYFDMVDIQEELEAFFGRRVDLLTPAALSEYFRDNVLSTKLTIYER